MKIEKAVFYFVFAFGMLYSVFGTGKSTKKTDSIAFTEKLGLGYNWGNTLEVWGAGASGFEVGWGAPVSTKEMFEDLKARGINTVRIPVAWSREMREDNIIAERIGNRVNEVVDYAIDSGLYVILNIHWDGGWINNKRYGFTKDYAGCMEKYTKIWEQIAVRYKNYDEHLIFESLNEELDWNDVWNRFSGAGNKELVFQLANKINQTFVDLIRNSGGNNRNRYLLIAGYATDINCTCDPLFKMPKDKKNRTMISVHYYHPGTFALISENVDWGANRRTWGTQKDISELNANMQKLKRTFSDKGIGVIIGEYGCPVVNKEPDSVLKYLESVATVSYSLGFCPVLWAGATTIYNRRELKFDDDRIGDMYKNLSEMAR